MMTDFPLRTAFRPGDATMFANWFDHKDQKYLAAYVLYKYMGAWPRWVAEAIKDRDIVMHDYWEIMINENMASAWINHCFKEQVAGLPHSSIEKVLQQISDT